MQVIKLLGMFQVYSLTKDPKSDEPEEQEILNVKTKSNSVSDADWVLEYKGVLYEH